MSNQLITREYMRKCGACYPDSKIAKLIPECGLTALELLHLDIPDKDKVWGFTRPNVIEKKIMKKWLDKLVERSKKYTYNAAAHATHAAYAAAYAADAAHAANAADAAYAAANAADAAAHAAHAAYAAERQQQVDDMIDLLSKQDMVK